MKDENRRKRMMQKNQAQMDLNNSFLHLMAMDPDENFGDGIEVTEEQLASELKALGEK